MKRLAGLTAVVLLLLSVPVMAEEQVDVRLNGELIGFENGAVNWEGTTMIPLRATAEIFGGQVSWEPEGQFITILFGEDVLNMKIGAASYVINGYPDAMDTAPILHEGTTMVPLWVMGEVLDCEVSWDPETATANMTKEGLVLPEDYAVVNSYTDEDLLWLARIVNVEGLDIGYEAKLAIANVVLNRVKGDEYPDTVYNVIKDTDYAVQFPPAHRSSFDTLEPDEQSWQAAKDALEGSNNIEDCLYFNNSPFKWKADDLYTIIEGEYFYR